MIELHENMKHSELVAIVCSTDSVSVAKAIERMANAIKRDHAAKIAKARKVIEEVGVYLETMKVPGYLPAEQWLKENGANEQTS
jgi:hypothetical protein